METESKVIRIAPICIRLNDAQYDVDVMGKTLPSGKFFTCEVKGMGMFIIEAVANPLTKKYSWVVNATTDYAALIPLIKKEIENQMRAA